MGLGVSRDAGRGSISTEIGRKKSPRGWGGEGTTALVVWGYGKGEDTSRKAGINKDNPPSSLSGGEPRQCLGRPAHARVPSRCSGKTQARKPCPWKY